MNPLCTFRNPYHENEKESSIYTPPSICNFLFDLLKNFLINRRAEGFTTILDTSVGSGNLLNPFISGLDESYTFIGFDIEESPERNSKIKFVNFNYLSLNNAFSFLIEREVFVPDKDKVALVIQNPPFNRNINIIDFLKKNKKGKSLLVELFLEKTFELFGNGVPCVCIAPMGLRLNQRLKSGRWRKMRDDYPKITSIISLPIDIFPGVEFHCEILIFNIKELDPHYFIPDKYLGGDNL